MNVAAGELTDVVSIRIYCEAAVDGVRLNSGTPLQFEAITGGAEVTLTTALVATDNVSFYAAGGVKIVGVDVPRG